MEFSFGSERWVPRELLAERKEGEKSYALGLHAPGAFDRVLNVDKCFLQSEPANRVRRNTHMVSVTMTLLSVLIECVYICLGS